MNLYDLYIWNKDLGGYQITIVFYIDNLMLAHLLPEITTDYVKKLDGIYRMKDHLMVTREKYYKYLDMMLDFTLIK